MWCQTLPSFGLVILNWKIRGGSSAASSSVGDVIFLSLCSVFSTHCWIPSGSMADLSDHWHIAEAIHDVGSSYISPFAPHACWKEVNAVAGEFLLSHGGSLRLKKWLSRPLLSSGPESCKCSWNDSAISRLTDLCVDCGFADLYGFRGGTVV